jgi:biotin carboxyl carrier protein
MANPWAERLAAVKLRVDVQGREHLLEIQRNGSDCGFKITGAFNAEGICSIEEVSPGVFSILRARSSVVVRLIENNGGVEAWVGSRKLKLSISDPRDAVSSDKAAASRGPKEIRAFMPGKVVKLLVQVGDVVESGDGLIIVEAMKMQNEMKSPKHGRIRVIHVVEGDTVSAGTALLTVD